MSRDLLKEAIADAKAVKETAIANAKAYLEEAFTPQLRSMLAAKLEEMDEETEEVKEMSDPDMRHGEDEDGEPETGALKQTEKDREITEEEELDLDEILDSLSEEDESRAERADVDKYEYEKGKEAGEDEEEDGEEEEEEEIDLEDMTSDDLKSFIETVIADMVEAGELEAGEEVEGEEVEVEDEFEFEDEVEITEIGDEYKTGDALNPVEKATFEESVKGVEDEIKRREGAIRDNRDHKKDLDDDIHHDEMALGKLKKDLKKEKEAVKEAYSAIKTLKSELNEINLLNAKLLYTNKIFRSKNLTESQKVKILNAFDKAGSVKEVKIVFETLNENIKIQKPKTSIKENLGFASKATGASTGKSAKPVVETDPMVARFKKLAGLS